MGIELKKRIIELSKVTTWFLAIILAAYVVHLVEIGLEHAGFPTPILFLFKATAFGLVLIDCVWILAFVATHAKNSYKGVA